MNPDGDRGQREPDALIGSVIAVTIRASGQTYRAQQAGHMTARNQPQNPKVSLRKRDRPHMSP